MISQLNARCILFMLVSLFFSKSIVAFKTSLRNFHRNSYLEMSTSSTPAKNVLVAIANGSEEIESVTIINTLVRAGATVTVASVENSLQITGSRGIKIVADKLISECDKDWDLIACPGGMPGAEHLRDSAALRDILLKQHSAGKPLAAICASPAVVLSTFGILTDKQATCYPAPKFKEIIPQWQDNITVVDGHIITSQGPATSLSFSLQLVEVLFGPEVKARVSKEMLYQH